MPPSVACCPAPSVGGHTLEPLKPAPKKDWLMVPPLTVALLTVSARDCVALCCGEEESATCAVKVNCPVCVVVPESVPLACSVTPLGSCPDATDQVYGVLPPEAARGSE